MKISFIESLLKEKVYSFDNLRYQSLPQLKSKNISSQKGDFFKQSLMKGIQFCRIGQYNILNQKLGFIASY